MGQNKPSLYMFIVFVFPFLTIAETRVGDNVLQRTNKHRLEESPDYKASSPAAPDYRGARNTIQAGPFQYDYALCNIIFIIPHHVVEGSVGGSS